MAILLNSGQSNNSSTGGQLANACSTFLLLYWHSPTAVVLLVALVALVALVVLPVAEYPTSSRPHFLT